MKNLSPTHLWLFLIKSRDKMERNSRTGKYESTNEWFQCDGTSTQPAGEVPVTAKEQLIHQLGGNLGHVSIRILYDIILLVQVYQKNIAVSLRK